MLDAKLRDLIEKRRAATPGPWRLSFSEQQAMQLDNLDAEGYGLILAEWPSEWWGEQGREGIDIANAAFIAEAANFPFEELAAALDAALQEGHLRALAVRLQGEQE